MISSQKSQQDGAPAPRCRFKPAELAEEVNTCLGPDARFTTADIRNPQPHRIQEVFSKLLRLVLGDHVDFSKVPDVAVGRFIYPEVQNCLTPLVLLGLLRGHFRGLHPNLGFQDMELRDFLNPEKNRVFRFISNLMNFCAFRFAKISIVDETEKHLSDRRSKIEEFRRQIDEYNMQMNDAVMASEERKNDIAHIRRELNAAAATTRSMSEELKAALTAVKSLEKVEEKCAGRVAHLDTCMENLRLDKERLQDQCVSSPDKLKGEAASLRDQVEKKQAEARAKSEEAGRITDEVERMKQCVGAAKVAAETVKRCGAVLKEAPAVKEDEQNQAKALQDLRLATQNLTLMLDEWQKKFDRLKKDLADVRMENENEVEEIHCEVEAFQRDQLAPLELNLKKLVEELNGDKEKIRVAKVAGDSKTEACKQAYAEFDAWKLEMREQFAAELDWEVKEFQKLVTGITKLTDELEICLQQLPQIWLPRNEG